MPRGRGQNRAAPHLKFFRPFASDRRVTDIEPDAENHGLKLKSECQPGRGDSCPEREPSEREEDRGGASETVNRHDITWTDLASGTGARTLPRSA